MLAPPGRTMSNLMTAHGSSEVPCHSGPTDGNVLRMQLRADMLEVANEQQRRWQEWAMQWERKQGEHLERHFGEQLELEHQVQKLCEELPHRLFHLLSKASSTQERVDLSEAEPPQESRALVTGGGCGAAAEIVDLDEAADAGAVWPPRKSETNEWNVGAMGTEVSNEDLARRTMPTLCQAFISEKVAANQGIVRLATGAQTPEANSALYFHLKNVQQRHKHRSEKKKKKQALTGCFVTIVESSAFKLTCALLILLNTIFVAYEVDTSVGRAFEDPPRDLPEWFSYVTMGFTCAFALELLLRLAAFRLTFFTGLEYKWNLFDLCVVLCSIVDLFLSMVQISPLRILRVLRVVRTLRILSVIRFCQSLRIIVYCILNGMVQLAWALVLLFGLITLFSIVCMQGVSTYLLDNGPEESGGDSASGLLKGDDLNYEEMRQELYRNYRSIWRACMAMLMSVSGGVGWGDVLKPLAVISHGYLLLFIMFVVFVLFGVLNVITGLFVEQAMQIRDRDLRAQAEMNNIDRFLADMQDIFIEADTDESGVLTQEELDNFLGQDRIFAYMSSYELDVSDLSTIFRLMDMDNSGQIQNEEWLIGCLTLHGQAKTLDIMRIFERMDKLRWQICEIETRIGIDAVCHV